MAEWLSSHVLLLQPRVSLVQILRARTWHRSSSHAEAASHMPQLEGPTTKKYIQLCTGGIWGDKEKKRRLATVVSSGANLKKKENVIQRNRNMVRNHKKPLFQNSINIYKHTQSPPLSSLLQKHPRLPCLSFCYFPGNSCLDKLLPSSFLGCPQAVS